MNTVTASLNTNVRLMTEMSQRRKNSMELRGILGVVSLQVAGSFVFTEWHLA